MPEDNPTPSPQEQSPAPAQPAAQPSAQYAAPPPPPPPAAAAPPYTPPYTPYGYAAPTPYPNYGMPPRKRRSPWFWVAVFGGSFAVIVLLITAMVWSTVRNINGDGTAGLDGFGSRIGVIEINGVILDADKVNTQLRKFGDDSSIKAIILHINSPGGGAAASQEIYHEVLRVRTENHKKVIASVESVGASGAYYIASGCDKIYANDASVVGSIGVIMEWTNYGDLMKWAKLKNVVIHAGTLKDAGDPTREMTPEEQVYFQSLVDNMYGQFVNDVAAGRHTTYDRIKPLATGQVWTGQQAIDPKLGLIDKIGGFRVALIDTARSVGINGEPAIARPPSDKKGLLASLTDDTESLFPNPSKLLDQAPGFYFMWK